MKHTHCGFVVAVVVVHAAAFSLSLLLAYGATQRREHRCVLREQSTYFIDDQTPQLKGENGELESVGVVRAMAAEEIEFLAPPPDVMPGKQLVPEELARVRANRKHLIEYGMTFGIEAERIGQFLLQCRGVLEGRGIVLSSRLFPQ